MAKQTLSTLIPKCLTQSNVEIYLQAHIVHSIPDDKLILFDSQYWSSCTITSRISCSMSYNLKIDRGIPNAHHHPVAKIPPANMAQILFLLSDTSMSCRHPKHLQSILVRSIICKSKNMIGIWCLITEYSGEAYLTAQKCHFDLSNGLDNFKQLSRYSI